MPNALAEWRFAGWKSFPAKPRQVFGIGLYCAKAILGGRTGDVADQAKRKFARITADNWHVSPPNDEEEIPACLQGLPN